MTSKSKPLVRDHRLVEALDEALGAMVSVRQAVALRSTRYALTERGMTIEKHAAEAMRHLREAAALANLSVEEL